jgi:DNA-binding MarR family transcriptional regulator
MAACRLHEQRPVHTTFFSVKRAFHGVLRIARRPLAHFGLTPARFDMLYVLYRDSLHRCWQSTLRDALGVTAPTACRMLASLQKLGLVTRERDRADRRQRVVRLTDSGLRRMQKVHDELVASGAAQLAVDCALAFPKQHDRRAANTAMRIFERFLVRMRFQFGDIATLSYRDPPGWHYAGARDARFRRIPMKYKLF